MMRGLVHKLLSEDSVLSLLIPDDRWFARSAVPDRPTLPFAVLAWTGFSARVGNAEEFSLIIYQKRGSYRLCRTVLDRAEMLMKETPRIDGLEVLAEATWNGRGGDLYDDEWTANFINSDFTLVGK